MARVHLFNPENDLALAHGGRCYTAPPNAMALHRAGRLLPVWYAVNGDYVVAQDEDMSWLESIKRQFGIDVSVYDPAKSDIITGAIPWGWSLDAARQLIAAGIPESIIPDDKDVACLRQLSHRRTSVTVMQKLRDRLSCVLPPLPFEAVESVQVLEYRKKNGGCYVKSPWSSSGRGVFDATLMGEEELMRRCDGIIRRQGSVMCESRLDKVEDFATLFYSDGTKVSHVGYSAFFNEHGTSYGGNIVLPDRMIKRHIETKVGSGVLDQISILLQEVLTELITPYYQGYFGVDMMVYRDDRLEMRIAPCIEVNLRMTMGVVAWHLNDRYLAPGSQGLMRVEYGKCSAAEMPPVVKDNRLVEGTLSLVPLNANFSITLEAAKKREML